MVLFIECEIMHVCVCWGWLKTWKLECTKESPRKNATSDGASHARRATGLAETAGARRRVSSETAPTENPRRYNYLEQGDLQEKFPRLNNILAHYCCIAV